MTPEQYKSFINRSKKKRSYRSIEDTIIKNDIAPYLTFLSNIGRLKCYWTKITNEAIHSIAMGVKQKRMGKKKGVGDFYLHQDGKAYWLEVKQPGGKQSDSQKGFEQNCIKNSIGYAVVHNSKEVEEVLKEWGILK